MAQMTAEETRKLLDDLFALPDREKAKKKDSKPKAPPKATASAPVKVQCTPQAWKPQASIIEVVHQQCTTCGSEHQYLRNRLIRFEARAKGTLHTAIEIETLTIERLPREVDHTYEDTNVCPSCVVLSRNIDDICALTSAPQQMELFHG